jgi:hypothetical protein
MPSTPLIPPNEAPPDAWRKANAKFNWKLAVLGAAGGAIVGAIALLLNASDWWWLAVPVGLCVGFLTRQSFKAPASWAQR